MKTTNRIATLASLTASLVFTACLGSFEPPSSLMQQDTVEYQPDVVVGHDTTPSVHVDTSVAEDTMSSVDTTQVIPECSTNDDCNDGEPCTGDFCNPAGKCVHPPILDCCHDDSNCETWQHCNADAQCDDGCTVNADCDDGSICLEGKCKRWFCDTDNDCDSSDYCWNQQICEPVQCPSYGRDPQCVVSAEVKDHECLETFKTNGTPCEDENICTLNTVCFSGRCDLSLWANCDDGKECTNDYCDPEVGCVSEPIINGACSPP
ncbi:MAG TPA: hypothetical protein DEP63_03075 [Candidatus Magasanikbacteria bacterium]|nr:hypothetical protein [Candidatus Magasanikbacteria bacterium]HCC13705.1 hypothetical protein [Candidatus Magasanikbacteria bacterium]HCM54056.1 hypothetical protein [Candidatus Magasanikbacteria bacterium]